MSSVTLNEKSPPPEKQEQLPRHESRTAPLTPECEKSTPSPPESEVNTLAGSDAGLDSYYAKYHVDMFSKGMLKLYGAWAVAFMGPFMSGYGVSSMTAINALSQYQTYCIHRSRFRHVANSRLCDFLAWPNFAAMTALLGMVLLAFAKHVSMLLAGRFFLGAGLGMMQTAAPPFIVETAPPLNRGFITGLSNGAWILGGCLATGITIGTSRIASQWAWRIPAILSIMVTAVLFLPESPRWLVLHGHENRARDMLVKYHGNGVMTPVVQLELAQIVQAVKMAPVSRWWDCSGLVNSRSKRYRLMLALMMGAFSQLSGNALSYFLPALYKEVGVTRVRHQLVMTLVASLVSLSTALLGTYQSDRLGRRPVLILSTMVCALTLSAAMLSSALSHVNVNASGSASDSAASKAAIACLILFGAAYAWGYQPLLPVYPSEVLSTEQRSAGMGCFVLCLNLCALLGQLVIPIALKRIGWWTYLPFICWDVLETVAWYIFAVETKGRTLEELDEIFNAPHPVRASLQRTHYPSKTPMHEDTMSSQVGVPTVV
ncbi:hypothetical protein TREMEDRAFT_63529 [Tremella mesenterica DSM 1558]|uniref:uncharacterized protein n=1 Tax=Tremella mesenterica (strain ATCC 24925 / CBS 8224 / DSM 1558 / NBRC 9311 / NRRL Y-6157 / RJB 2259-6 / UBC 559-6) TaxID=578456 RepID=UPI0003F49169|nr:uncharacterized protein TREMEDRAFT_63529 [Tremella mesenterica DSM 1558]EIW68359.1 hypothetical protein TREMEDRAFT_63529 [Tremella mesenterica DSM 1558]